jgi:hypothetical protein
VQKLSKPAKRKLLRKISKALELVSNGTRLQRVEEQTLENEQISEGETTFQRVDWYFIFLIQIDPLSRLIHLENGLYIRFYETPSNCEA